MRRYQVVADALCLSLLAVVFLIDRTPADTSAIGAIADLPPPADADGGFCPAVAPDETGRFESAQKPRFRTCRCSCGAPCRTDADCDGAPCAAGITCC